MNWSDITLRQWYNLQKVNDYEDILDKRLAMIAAVTDSTFDEVEGLKMSEINRLAKEFEFLNYPIKTKVVTGWKDYKFVVKLSDLTAGQMIDFLETAKEDIENKLHVLLAIMDTGSKKDFEAKQKELLECPITIVQGISNFFFSQIQLITPSYPRLFPKEIKGDESDSSENEPRITGNFVELWSWFIWLEKLAVVHNCKIDDIYNWKAPQLLTWMEYILNKEANEQLKK